MNRTKSQQTTAQQATAILSAPQDDELLGVDQAGKLTNLSPWTWRRWAYEGKVSSVKLGTRLLIPRSAVNKLILENTRPALEGGGAA